jgi:hypothetical protein
MATTDRLVTAAAVEAAKREFSSRGRLACLKDLRAREPDLYEAVSRIAIDSLTDVDLSCPGQAKEWAFAAVWNAVIVAIFAYQRCHYELWAEMALGTRLAKLDPHLTKTSRRDRRRSGTKPTDG